MSPGCPVLARFDIIVFDVWGTLLRLEPMWGFVAEGLASVLNKPVNATRAAIERVRGVVKSRVGFIAEDHVSYSVRLLAEELGSSPSIVRRGIARGVLGALEHVGELVYDDAVRGLEEARRLARFVGVVGNALLWPSSYTRLLLEKSKLSYYIDAQVYGDEAGCYKPSPCIWARLFEELGLSSPSCVHIGDSVREDIGGAIAAGCKAVLVKRAASKDIESCGLAGLTIIRSLDILSKALVPETST